MSEDSAASTRRSLLAAGLGALAATVAGALGRAPVVRAADPNDVLLGGPNSAVTTTQINESVSNHSAFWGNATFNGFVGTTPGNAVGVRGDTHSVGADGMRPAAGVWGRAANANLESKAVGVFGSTESPDTQSAGVMGLGTGGARGVVGQATAGGTGVHAQSESGVALRATSVTGGAVEATGHSATFPAVRARNMVAGVALNALQWGVGGPGNVPPSASTPTGVFGATEAASGTGVWGNGQARGVFGETTGGIGLAGLATTGKALSTDGRIEFKKVSGVATISIGATQVTVTPPVTVAASALVFLTPLSNLEGRSFWFVRDAPNGRFFIKVSASHTAQMRFAWLLVG